jgi:Organic Anion Transporter Polypeptide (OATP) family
LIAIAAPVVLTALVSALAGAIGGFAGGLVMSRMKLEPAGAVRLIIISTSCFALGILIILFLECPQVEMAGNIHPVHGTYVLSINSSVFAALVVQHGRHLLKFSVEYRGRVFFFSTYTG